jgi:hypothetical protein
MDILDTLRQLWSQQQEHWSLVSVKAPDIPVPPGTMAHGKSIDPNSAYVVARMRSMSISSTRTGWARFHGALYSNVTVELSDGTTTSIQSVIAPDFLRDLDPKSLQNVLQIDRTIFGPVPCIGTRISFETGVFAVKHADLASPFLTCLANLSSAAGVSLLSAAKPFVEPIKQGLELLTGTSSATSLEIALSRELDPPVTGWFALVRKTDVRPADLSVIPQNFELRYRGNSLGDVPYLLFSIDGVSQRADWAQIPDLREAWNEFRAAVKDGNRERAEVAAQSFRRRALICPELLPAHADDLIQEAEKQFRRIFGDPHAKTAALTISEAALNVPPLEDMTVSFRATL